LETKTFSVRKERDVILSESKGVHGPSIHWVLAFKFAQELNTAERLCKEGMEQLKNCGYGEEFEGKPLRRMVLVFSQKDQKFIC